jgi:hypothetical protein
MGENGQNKIPSREEIAVCAYLIWEYEGHPEHLDKEHWGQAEVQLIVAHAHDQWMAAQRLRAMNPAMG